LFAGGLVTRLAARLALGQHTDKSNDRADAPDERREYCYFKHHLTLSAHLRATINCSVINRFASVSVT
jgi:hypothetical protein